MTHPNNDTEQIDLIAGYVLNDLSAEETSYLNQVLTTTPTLHREVTAFQETFAAISYGLPLLTPKAHLKSKLLNTAYSPTLGNKVEPFPSNVISITSRQRHRPQWMPTIGTGIAAIAVATVGLNLAHSHQQSQQSVALQQQLRDTQSELANLREELQASQKTSQKMATALSDPNTQIYSLVGKTSNQTNRQPVTARVITKPGDRTIMLVAQNLPQPPDGQVYRFWSLTKAASTPTYCGEFRQDSGGTAQWTASDTSCMQNPRQIMVTLESQDNPATAPGPVIMESPTNQTSAKKRTVIL
jgi:anti-sigma-K factor RskA